MFFDEDDERFIHHDLLHVVSREIFALRSNLDVSPFGFRNVPTHTEDGIPIRKLYVSNLPPKTTRTELFGVFAPYGFIKSCWLRMGDKGPNKTPTPTYAFITFSDPADAHKALQAPSHEKMLRGRNLRISPADSWHQPAEDADGRVRWKPRGQRRVDCAYGDDNTDSQSELPILPQEVAPETSSNEEANNPSTSQENNLTTDQEEVENDGEPHYNILEILNRDCLHHILTYVPITDLIRSEGVSKSWQNMVQEYLASVRTFKTSWWQHVPVTLTTAVLRRVLGRLGPALLRLHIDHHWSALNDRTAHTVGKFCPNLEELKVVGMNTKNWNPLIYGCKNLKSLSFISCNKLTDSSLVHLVKNESSIENLTVANNTHVTGLFLTGSNPQKLSSLAFYNCYSLQGTVLCAAIDTLPNLTTLRLDMCPVTMWKIIPMILSKLPRLEELSLSEYTSVEICLTAHSIDAFVQSLGTLGELKVLNLSRNIYITNAVLKQVAHTCHKLESLNVSSCNSRKNYPAGGVSDDGVSAVCAACRAVSRLDVSYLGALTDAGLAGAARLPRLAALTARGCPNITSHPLAACLAACPLLEEVDVCGSDKVMCSEVVEAAAAALCRAPDRRHPLTLRLAATSVSQMEELPAHRLLVVNIKEDRSNPQLRPDFVDRIFHENSDDSLDDLYDHEDFDDFLGPDDELFLEDEMEDDEYDGLYAYALHAPDIILL